MATEIKEEGGKFEYTHKHDHDFDFKGVEKAMGGLMYSKEGWVPAIVAPFTGA